MEASGQTAQTPDVSEDVVLSADDTLISPYNSPQKEQFTSDVKYGSGDFIDDAENDHSLANQVFPASVEKKTVPTIEALQVTMQNFEPMVVEDAPYVDHIPVKIDNHNSGEEGGAETEATMINGMTMEGGDQVLSPACSENIISVESATLPSPEEEKEKIIAEMLASAGDATPNDALTQIEMMSISKRMEEEFRSMVMAEQQKKKLSIEGPSYAARPNLPDDSNHTVTPDTTTKQSLKNSTTPLSKVPKAAKTSYTSRLPTSQSRTSRPNSAKSTPTGTTLSHRGPPSSPTRARCTPTTIRLTPRNTTPNLSGKDLRSPLTPTASQIKAKFGRPSSGIACINTTPLKASHTTPVQSSRTTPAKRPLTSPRRPPSAQSSDSGGRCMTPNMRHVQSKIGSLQNAKHTPGGGKVKIESRKSDYSGVTSKVGSKTNQVHVPSGGKVKIESKKLDYSSVGARCGSFANASHTPGGGKVKIDSKKLDFSHVGSKCGSMANVTHTPGGGKVRVESKKLDFTNVSSKCGSRGNMHHTPQGGKVKVIRHHRLDFSKVSSKIGSLDNCSYSPPARKVKIFHEKPSFENVSGRIGSLDNVNYSPGGGKVRIFHAKVDTSKVQSRIGSKDNINHTPGGGKVKIWRRSMDLSQVKSKCGSLDNANHVPGGGRVEIFNEIPDFKEAAKSKIGSLDNATHVPGGGDVKIYDEKLYFRDVAVPKTDTGCIDLGSAGSSELAMSM